MKQNWENRFYYGWKSSEALNAHAYLWPAIKLLLPGGVLNILDVGCGNGYIASQLAAMGNNVIGIDASEDGIAIAREAHPYLRFEVSSAYDDFTDLDFDADVAVSSEVIEHLYRPILFFENLFNFLRPGGHVILTTPYHGYLKNLALSLFNRWDRHHTVDWDGGHIKFFSEKTITCMLNACGFDNVIFCNAGRVHWLWKSMVCRARKPLSEIGNPISNNG